MIKRAAALVVGLAVVALLALAGWWHWGPDNDRSQDVRGVFNAAQNSNARASDLPTNEPDRGAGPRPWVAENSAPVHPSVPLKGTSEQETEEPPLEPAEVAQNLEGLLRKMIPESSFFDEIAETFLALQDLGQPGLERAARLFWLFEKRWGLASGDVSRLEADWGSVAQYMKLFTPELVKRMVEYRGDYTAEAYALALLQNVSHKPDWKESERLALVIAQLESAEEGEIAEYRRMAATQALMRMPSAEAADAAARFVQSGSEPWSSRNDAVWALARVGRDKDFDVIRWVELNDKEPRVRQTAEFHRLARGVTEPGFLVLDIDPQGTAAETTLKIDDIVRWTGDVPFKFAVDIPESFGEDQPLQVARQGQYFEVVLPKGVHGLKLSRVPPAFPD